MKREFATAGPIGKNDIVLDEQKWHTNGMSGIHIG